MFKDFLKNFKSNKENKLNENHFSVSLANIDTASKINLKKRRIIKNFILFQGNIDLLGNSRSFFDFLYKNHRSEYQFAWLLENSKYSHLLPNKIEILYSTNPLDIKKAQLAKYVVHSSIQLFNKKNNQIGINLWHGIPIKTIGFTENPPASGYSIFKNDFFFVSSDYCKLIISACFKPKFERIIVTGQSRNDLILNTKKNDSIKWLKKILKIKNINCYKKIILYAPTFKFSTLSKNDIDKAKLYYKNIFQFQNFNEKSFDTFLKSYQILFIVKPHFSDEDIYKKNIPESHNIKLMCDNDLKKERKQLYELFKLFDVLITDYSSIYIDYLIINKPIIFVHSTIKEYSENRGFILKNNAIHFMPGKKIMNQKDLHEAILDSITKDTFLKDRSDMMNLFHKHADGDSSKRIYEFIKRI